MDWTLKRKIENLNSVLDSATKRMERLFGQSKHCILGNSYEHLKWYKIKLDEPSLSQQDVIGSKLLPTWSELTDDLFSALHRTATVLFDTDQINPRYRGNRMLLESVIATDDWERIHDMTMSDLNMTVIAALRIQEGWIKTLQEAQEQAQARQEQRDQERKEKQDQRPPRGDFHVPAQSSGADQEESQPDGEQQPQEPGGDFPVISATPVPGDNNTQQGGEPGSGSPEGDGQPGDVDGEAGENDDEEDGDYEEGADGGDQAEDGDDEAGDFDPIPEPNNPVEAEETGRKYVEAMQAAQIALEEAEKLAQAAEGGQSIEDAIAEAEAALRASQELEDAVQDQVAYEELVEAENDPGEALQKAINLALKEIKDADETVRAWGLTKGSLKKMDPKEALELEKLLRQSENLKQIAKLIGSNRIAISKRKTKDKFSHGPTLRVGVETGNKLNKLMSSQKMMMVTAPDMFRWRYANRNLQQYKTRIEQLQENGTGVFEVDSSGSMWGGHPFTYSQIAKATCISFIEYMQEAGRDCVVVLFDHGVRQVIDIPKNLDPVSLLKLKIQIAENDYAGGTDFFEPLMTGFKKIRETRYLETADICLITDGQCHMTPDQIKQIKEQQDELRVNIITVLMPGGRAGQMADLGPVETVKTALQDANQLALTIVEKMESGYV